MELQDATNGEAEEPNRRQTFTPRNAGEVADGVFDRMVSMTRERGLSAAMWASRTD